ncbi:MAG: NAD(P)-dependent oxidoreductase [Bacteroidota bacterium]
MTLKIGILREEKQPADQRVPFTPAQCAAIKHLYPDIDITIQPSPNRCFADELYQKIGITIAENISDCDFLMGIKEVPHDKLIPNKKYFFFSHTIKKQAHNKSLMQSLIKHNNTMIDYETLRWKNGDRVLGFGRFAGIVGAYNGLLTWGKKFKTYTLKPAYQCTDYAEVKAELKKIQLPHLKIILTGNGRVSLGALELLKEAGIRQVTASDILTKLYAEPVFAELLTENLYERIDGKPYDRSDFHHDPTRYRCVFRYYLPYCDMLINGIYWDEKMDRLFDINDTRQPTFKTKVIADISCDINGSVPITVKDTKITDPVFGYSPSTMGVTEPFLSDTIDVMAVSNLPTELPRDASEGFGQMLIDYVLPELIKPHSPIIDAATICKDGKLTHDFEYLADYAY